MNTASATWMARGFVSSTSITPSGMPIAPPIRNGHSRPNSRVRRMVQTRPVWLISPPDTTSSAAWIGEIACSQIEVATTP